MPLSANERQSLLGPLVIGIVLGAFIAFAVVAFSSEYGQYMHPAETQAEVAIEAGEAFVGAAGGIFGVLGVLPLVVGRLTDRRAKGRSA